MKELPDMPCEVEKARIDAVEDLSRKLALIITGNGNPENGLVVKQDRTLNAVNEISEKWKERNKKEWAILMVAIGLLATSLWQIITP